MGSPQDQQPRAPHLCQQPLPPDERAARALQLLPQHGRARRRLGRRLLHAADLLLQPGRAPLHSDHAPRGAVALALGGLAVEAAGVGLGQRRREPLAQRGVLGLGAKGEGVGAAAGSAGGDRGPSQSLKSWPQQLPDCRGQGSITKVAGWRTPRGPLQARTCSSVSCCDRHAMLARRATASSSNDTRSCVRGGEGGGGGGVGAQRAGLPSSRVNARFLGL
jgi:hypothetical protein